MAWRGSPRRGSAPNAIAAAQAARTLDAHLPLEAGAAWCPGPRCGWGVMQNNPQPGDED
jgi:hypothetical protein